jgi:A/G-specific adenine glycosylase
MNLLVAEFRLLENLRLQLELDELLNPLALQQNLRALLVDSDAKSILLREKEGVRFWRKVETKILKQRTKPSRLIGRKRVSVRIHLSERERPTFNANRPTPKRLPGEPSESDILQIDRLFAKNFGVGRLALNVYAISVNSTSDTASFRHVLLSWYRKQGRDLPWRRTSDPYAVLVSEFMLQQTQVATVIPYYKEWMQRFPDFATLASASEHDVLCAWQGLGYYARARNLHATAQTIIGKHKGRFPRLSAAIRSLPGVGRYTANAILTFAFNQSVPIVEANTARLLARLFNLRIPIHTGRGREALWRRASELLPNQGAGKYNSAFMDLGALVCAKRPNCAVCPVRNFCAAETPSELPIRKAPPPIRLRTENHGFSVRRGRVLLEQSQDRWRGMWMLPRLATVPPKGRPLHVSEFPFTNHRITLTVFPQRAVGRCAKSFQRWFPVDGLDSIPLPSPHRRALEMLFSASSQRLCDLATQS